MSSAVFGAGESEALSVLEREAREAIIAQRRRRALSAVAELAHRGGIGAVTTAAICRVARLTPATVGLLFESREDCLRSALIAAHWDLFEPVRRASLAASGWYEGMRAALGAFFGQIAAEPLPAELCLLHGEATVLATCGYVVALAEIEALMAGGREAGRIAAGDDYLEPAPELEEFLARAVLWLATLRIEDGEVGRLPADGAKLVGLAGAAFFGVPGTGMRWRELQAGWAEQG